MTFTKPVLGLVEFAGSKANNIVIAMGGNDVNGGNVFVDDNPRMPASERYKFVSTTKQPLTLYVSPDGVHFTEKGVIAGAWRTSGDTQPSLMWDVHSSTYLLYGRIDDPAGSYSTTRNCKGTLNGKAIDTTADRKVGFSQTANLSIAPPADPYVIHPFIHSSTRSCMVHCYIMTPAV